MVAVVEADPEPYLVEVDHPVHPVPVVEAVALQRLKLAVDPRQGPEHREEVVPEERLHRRLREVAEAPTFPVSLRRWS